MKGVVEAITSSTPKLSQLLVHGQDSLLRGGIVPVE